MKNKKRKKRKCGCVPKCNHNPPPEEKMEDLWKQCRKYVKDLTRKEFQAGIEEHLRQHHSLPDKITFEDVPGVDPKVKILVSSGELDNFVYNSPKKSRKKKIADKFIHKTKDRILVSPAGLGKQVKVLHGKMKMKKDGWFHH